MKALLIIAHGSRRHQSNDEVTNIAKQIRTCEEHDFDIVESAFLELAETLIPTGIERCIKSGAKEIIVVPYFLNSGTHVTKDIPEIISAQKSLYPDINITLTRHLGASSVMLNLILQTASDTVIN